MAAIFRPKALLIAENLCLRQQLLVLQRRHPRPRLSNADRCFSILGSRWFGGWRNLIADCEARGSSGLAAIVGGSTGRGDLLAEQGIVPAQNLSDSESAYSW
jgi:hypothetical protein